MADWQTTSSEVVYQTQWMTVRRDEVLNHQGTHLTYSYVEVPQPSVFIVALNGQGDIFLQRNFRYPVHMVMWEAPAGFVDSQEEPLVAAKRELAEETGLASDDWHELCTLYQANGIGNIPFTIFIARNARPTDSPRDEDEDITDQGFVSQAQINRMIASGEIQESAHIAALYSVMLYLKEDNNGSTNN